MTIILILLVISKRRAKKLKTIWFYQTSKHTDMLDDEVLSCLTEEIENRTKLYNLHGVLFVIDRSSRY